MSTTMSTTIGCAEAESAVLGCLLRLDLPSARRIAANLEPEDFTDPRMRLALAGVNACIDAEVTPDPVTVLGELRSSGKESSFLAHKQAGPFLADLHSAGPVTASAGYYVRIVLEHRARRRLQEAGQRLSDLSATASLVTAELVTSQECAELFRLFERVADCGRLNDE